MPAPPLTHHDILTLVEPFSRQGRHVDLAATDRVARRVTFKGVALAPAVPEETALTETLSLDSLGTGTFKLTRTITRPDGVKATVLALGDDPAALLARVQTVAPAQQFSSGDGYVIARSYAFESAGGSQLARGAPAPTQRVLSRGEVHAGGLVMGMNVSNVKGSPGDIHLGAASGEPFELPEDLLAVIGWDWARLLRNSDGGWTSRRRLRGVAERRTHNAEVALQQAAVHLARVLAAPPAQFHTRHLWARWGVVLRRGIPTLTSLAMIIAVLLLPQLGDRGPAPKFWLALHYLPIGILAVAFSLQELPCFEFPPLPRRLRAPGWRRPLTQGA